MHPTKPRNFTPLENSLIQTIMLIPPSVIQRLPPACAGCYATLMIFESGGIIIYSKANIYSPTMAYEKLPGCPLDE
jgi:hypothetical protein